MPTYLVERHLPGFTAAQLPEAAGLAKRTASEMAEQGTPIRYLRSTFVPAEEKCYCLFEGDSAETVRVANERAQLPFDRISEAEPISAEEV
jgi:hypothetical protein